MIQQILDGLAWFVFGYPLAMSYVWMTGALWYWFKYERTQPPVNKPPSLKSYPKVALVVPCYNEEDNARETITQLLAHNYPNFEVIAVNDGSKDKTAQILDQLVKENPVKLKVVHLAQNQGKAVGLRTACLFTDAEFILGIDGDAVLDPHAAQWMMRHMLTSPRVGAVTGNPRIRTRSSILGKAQVGEFSSIVGMIKRCQRAYGKVFTVSGVVTLFRKSALQDVKYWSPESLTEDIDISWKLQMRHWDIRFEPAALCWILMPETLTGLWKQRLRWAQGGVQALIKYRHMFRSIRHRRFFPVYFEYVTSLLWSYIMAGFLLLGGVFLLAPDLVPLKFPVQFMPGSAGAALGATTLLQIWIALLIDRKYDKNLHKVLFWTIWYPLVYWLLNMTTAVWAVPKTLLRKSNKRGTWVSPDRGIT